jgi:pyruvate dehydrogenase E2 component (dihydrolipoamide acetyltransferase)
MSTFEFTLPEIGDGIAEAEIISWLVAEGTDVAEHQAIVEVQTDKASIELTSPVTGKLQRHNAAVGEIVKVDKVIAVFAVANGDAAGVGDPTVPAASTAPAIEVPAAAPTALPGAGAVGTNGSKRRPLAAPTVRALARELGIDLADVPGTGPGGRVTRDDVVAFRDQPSAGDSASRSAVAPVEAAATRTGAGEDRVSTPMTARGEERRIPLRGLRRAIARRMTETLRIVPHVTGLLEIDVTELQEVLRDLRPVAEKEGVRLTWTAFFALATIQALKEFPELNASLDDERDEIVQYERIHLGVATATEQGLLVPVVREADRLSLLGLAGEITRVSAAARDRSAAVADLTGSTFTITNYGAVGGWHGTPMVNLPEIGIVGFGTVEPRPAVVDGALAIRTTVALSHTVDHRLIDGAVNARFGAAIRRRLEQPQLLLLGVNHGNG